MSNATLRKADRILEKLFDLPESEQAAFIATECAGDKAVESVVRRLLAQATEPDDRVVPGGALRLLGVETADFIPPTAPALDLGERVGPFRLVSVLGQGGMATVYRAERDDGQFEQVVALKVLDRRGESVARFEQERQILATLDHPNIAKLLDGGVTSRGFPYVVMEYIEGESLLDYCNARHLDVDERLGLFLTVVNAVRHAHRSLIVHRDIKSSNILVTTDGVPKLLDFGIAKLLEDRGLPHAAPATRAVLPLTPEYASPEQIRGEAMTVATDVYQLGYLLYLLLTGYSPYEFESTDFASLVEAIIRQPVIPPSSRVAKDSGSAPARLARRLRGDIDRVILKALHKDPGQRYAGAAEFAADIDNLLHDRPVIARPHSLGYRTRKFVWRHALAVAAVGTTTIAVIAGSAIFTYRLSEEKRKAEAEAARASEVSDFLIDLVKLSEPERSQGRTITVREVLDRAAGRIDNELTGQPRLQATLQSVVGQMYRELGEYDRAEQLLDLALASTTALEDADSRDLADVRRQRSQLYLYQSRYEDALRQIDATVDLLRADPATAASVLTDALLLRGQALRFLGRYDEARETLLRAQRTLGRGTAEADRLGALALLELGNVAYDVSEFDAARQHYRAAIGALSSDGQPPGLDLSRAHIRLAFVLVELNETEEAEAEARASLEIVRRIHDSPHPELLAPLAVLSSIQANRGEFDAAERSLNRQLEIATKTLGPDNAETATVMNNLGTLRFHQDRYAEAADWYRQAVEVRRVALGPEHPITGMTLSFEAYARYLDGDPAAETLYRDALGILTAAYEPGHRYIANVQHDLGRLYVEQGRFAVAESYLRTALEARRDVYGEDNLRTADTKLYLGACLSGLGKLGEGDRLIEQARAWLLEQRGAESVEVAHADLFRADWLRRSGRDQEAARLFERASALIRAEKPADHWLSRLAARIGERM